MKAADFKFNLIDSYLELLKKLSRENKLEIISKLSDSLNGPNRPSKKSLSDLFGSFSSEKSADEIIDEIKKSRNFNRRNEEL